MSNIPISQAAKELDIPYVQARSWLRWHLIRDGKHIFVPAAVVADYKTALATWHADDNLLTTYQAMKLLGLSEQSVNQLCKDGKLRRVKAPFVWMPGKITRASVRLLSLQRRAGVKLEEAGKQLGCSRQRAHELLQQGRLEMIPGTRPIRVTQASIDTEVARRNGQEGS
jgi:hypothetical protein